MLALSVESCALEDIISTEKHYFYLWTTKSILGQYLFTLHQLQAGSCDVNQHDGA